ncbi:dihydrolipoamide acetyltransferase family protein [Actinoplanes sp. URMC 104]|uniref:dihydrolipoamide acetyltransferase family protein n=1 Tax=Actinoplanes sp. URMC 104 TaxID=3423409 RepID=UPI003F1B1C3A
MSDQVFRLPDLGEGLTEAEVVRWLVSDGDLVEVDQPVVEVETAKSLVEVPTPYAGRVATRHAPEGSVLEVGKPLLTVALADTPAEAYREEERAGSGNVLIGYGTPGAAASPGRRRRPRSAVTHPPSAPVAPSAAAPSAAAPFSASPASASATPVGPPVPPASAAPVRARRVPLVVSPLVRRLARERGVDLRAVEGSGPDGLIVRADVERLLSAPPAPALAAPAAVSAAPAAVSVAPAAVPAVPAAVPAVPAAVPAASAAVSAASAPGERRTPLSGFRRAVSAALSRSRSEIPEATVWVDVDATLLWELREATRPGPGLLAYLARFVVAALKEYPVFNSRVDTERQEIVELDRIDLGIAVQGSRGLVVPAVTDAGALTTTRLDEEIRRVTEAAREGRVLGAGTFTLNNYGSFRVDGSAAIINHPQVAILGFGRILDRPWVVDGRICVRKITQMSFVFDHRVSDGATAAGFMRAVADAVENPASAIARL